MIIRIGNERRRSTNGAIASEGTKWEHIRPEKETFGKGMMKREKGSG